MISWLVILVLVGVALFALKLNKVRHKVWIIVVILVALFLYMSLALVYNRNELDFKSVEGLSDVVRVYLGWLGNSFQNLKGITGNAIKMDWTSTNGTFFNKTNIEAERL